MHEGYFYDKRQLCTEHSAHTVLSLLLSHIDGIESAIDIGCGVGTWLDAAGKLGVRDVLGIDGPWVNDEDIVIPRDCFLRHDLLASFPVIDRRFDMAISLEVAEHLSPEHAELFVQYLCASSDLVLFSAAIPHQDGVGHECERWPAFWHAHFRAEGYLTCDCIRQQIWYDESIPYWYRQNCVLYVKHSAVARCDEKLACQLSDQAPLALVHPILYDSKVRDYERLLTTKRLPLYARRLWQRIAGALRRR